MGPAGPGMATAATGGAAAAGPLTPVKTWPP
ncbi:MAG: hypothetical protein QOE50_898, partial [Sphingomonadales bacterium]|nr:hypothetical protein [Sphingomonadales bacterium]